MTGPRQASENAIFSGLRKHCDRTLNRRAKPAGGGRVTTFGDRSGSAPPISLPWATAVSAPCIA
jgi:hypothetical protein